MFVVMLITTRVNIATINHSIKSKIYYKLSGANMQEIYEARVQEFNKKANHIPKTEADAYSLLFGIISFAFLALLILYSLK